MLADQKRRAKRMRARLRPDIEFACNDVYAHGRAKKKQERNTHRHIYDLLRMCLPLCVSVRHVCACVRMCVCVCVCLYSGEKKNDIVPACSYVCFRVHICQRLSVCMRHCLFMCVCVCVCVCMCMRVHVPLPDVFRITILT